ncbi:L-ascorbate metabolism protein UlaG (beta-lactamase superfamily) [Palleronia aestuarii]|uniref:L-ascorbate metabolism protein UlaG (Beta-lactamase superfamily) n=1 Tax=Palleronia aestuarii TaxID=568105 RepID=A0A2W7NLP1_9RHOB|nr:MBL fold metallo-hydrolase [Palleronia aestuarii]PZX12202.1 L-ascorbate metabolism protein UlaG (beta-lactamase superfamily) [Palleronia aestuarii]
MRLREVPRRDPLPKVLGAPPGEALCLYWLGQAGFVIDGVGRRVVIDPYLSDSLEAKYHGSATPHGRMMPPPVEPGEIRHVDAVLSTHAHTDHLDGATLVPLLEANPAAVLVAAASSEAKVRERIGAVTPELILLDAGETASPVDGIGLQATRAAHETLEVDAEGRHLFLGYALRLCGATILHSGDTIPFPGQIDEVAALSADLALLPVNGRDAQRAGAGIPGNMTAREALALAEATGIPCVIAHHFDMFAFNTAPRAELDRIAAESGPVAFHPAITQTCYRLEALTDRSSWGGT